MPPDNPSIVRVTRKRIREIFNNSQHYTSIEDGEYLEQVLSDSAVTPDKARALNCPPATRSQYVRYYDTNRRWMVDVHRYLKPDGTLAASGEPDPYRVNMGDAIFTVDEPKPRKRR